MSEYQYYEFQAIDRPLGEADRQALRAISTRARITSASFTNAYEYGDLKGDPTRLMERWFDLHLYLANWGARRLMMRLPKRLVDRGRLDALIGEVEFATLSDSGENLILVINFDDVDSEVWDDGSGWLAALAPLRAEVLAGDLRMFYLLWLLAAEFEDFDAGQPEPLPGIGPMSASLEAFASFFGIDPDLVAAAAERPAEAMAPESAETVRALIAAMSDADKTATLLRLFDGDPHVAAALRARVRSRMAGDAPPAVPRTVADLRARAAAIGAAREQAAAEALAAAQEKRAKEAEIAQKARLAALARRGETVWRDVEAEIERRNPSGYDKAAELLHDLAALAKEQGSIDAFRLRLHTIREKHRRKGQFIERLTALE